MRNKEKQLLETAILNLMAVNHIMSQLINMIDRLLNEENE